MIELKNTHIYNTKQVDSETEFIYIYNCFFWVYNFYTYQPVWKYIISNIKSDKLWQEIWGKGVYKSKKNAGK